MDIVSDIEIIEDVDRAVFVHLDGKVEKRETLDSGYLSLDGNGYADRNLDAAMIFPLVFEVEFEPSFSPDTDSAFFFNAANSDASHRWILRIVSPLIRLDIRSGGALVYPILINLADYQPYWNDLGWNKIRCVLNPAGNSKLYLNEIEVVNTNSSITFTPSSSIDDSLTIGASTIGSTKYKGLINYVRTAATEVDMDAGSFIYAWEFNGDYSDSADGLDLTEQGSGNTFTRDSEYYDVLGYQPDKKALARLDQEIPLIWIKRPGPPSESDVAGTPQRKFEVKTTDGEDNPETYNVVAGGDIFDLLYEIRYITFHENDERAIAAQIGTLFPRFGVSLNGPASRGPFFFVRTASISVPGTRENELGGLFRVEARNVTIGEYIEAEAPAITDIRHEIEAVKEI